MILIDGSYLAHRSLHSTFNNYEYCYKKSIKRFLQLVYKLVDFHQVERGLIISWDKGIPIFRRKLYSEYKPDKVVLNSLDSLLKSKMNLNNEKFHEEEFLRNYEKLCNILHSMILPLLNCISIRVENCEADDIISFLVNDLKNHKKTIVSSDRDLLQLIDETTKFYDYTNNKTIDISLMKEEYGDNYKKTFLFYKAIKGDKSDNIPNIPWCSKKAAKEYSLQITNLIDQGLSLNESLNKIERGFKLSKKGVDSLKNSIDLLERNLKIMDLYYPIKNNINLTKVIRSTILSFLNIKIDYYQSIQKLENLNDFSLNESWVYVDPIFDCNSNSNIKEIVKNELR